MKKCISSKIILFTLVLCMALASFPISLGQTTDLTAEKTDQTQAESTQSTTQKETEKKVEEPSTQNAAVETTAQIQPQAAPVIPEYKGTADKPHPITNKYELASIGNPEFGREYPLDGNYIQTQDIVFDEADFKDGGDFYNDGKGWKPIGNIDRKGFVGKYNGDEYVINNIYVNRSGEGFCGIFGAGGKEAKLEINAEIFNIRTYNGFIKGDNSASGIFGGTVSVIENCINSNKVEGGFYAAGLAMKIAKGGRANKCINFGEMNGERANGGLFYLLSKNAVINNSCNKGSITGKGYKSGGIVACNEGRIINCYNSGNISSISWVGGIASESKDGEISNSFNHGNISLISIFCQHNYYAGGIVGNPYQTYINNCFNFGEIFSDVTLTSKSDTVYLGGISGSSSYTTIRNSYNRKKISIENNSTFIDNLSAGGINGNYTNTAIEYSYGSGEISAPVKNGVGAFMKGNWTGIYFDLDISSITNENIGNKLGGLETEQMTGILSLNNMPRLNDDNAYEPYEFGYPELKVFKYSDDPFVRMMSKKSVHVGEWIDEVAATGVTLNEANKTLKVDETFQLVATVAPDNATNKNVTWSSSDENIATVDVNGNIKAIGAGKATITVTTEDGNHTATCEVKVSKEIVINDSVKGTGINQIEYNGLWKSTQKPDCYNGDDTAINRKNDFAQIKFDGTQIKWIGLMTPNSGKADVYLDGEYKGTIDSYDTNRKYQSVLFDSGEIEDGEHTLKIIVTGEKRPEAKFAYVTIDAFKIVCTK